MPSAYRSDLVPGAAGLLAALALAFATPAAAAGFLPTLQELPDPDVIVTTADGREIPGRLSSYSWGFRGLDGITVVDAEGLKHRLGPGEVERLVILLNRFSRLALFAEATTTIEKAAKTDYEPLAEATELIFEPVRWPDGPKTWLLQRVNPGFDTLIQVYGLPNAREGTFSSGSLQVAGDEPKAYLAVRRGGEPIRVRKKSYEDDFDRLFADCPELLERYRKRDRRFRDFADHVYAYELSCR